MKHTVTLIACFVYATLLTTLTAQDNTYWLEAECAELGYRWTKVLNAAAAGGAYVETQYVDRRTLPADVAETQER